MSEPSGAPPATAVLTTLALVVAAIGALFAVDTFLAALDRAARRAEAAQLFERGRELAAAGRHAEAIDRFRSALAIDRGNRGFRLALAGAQLAAGRLDAADSTLLDLLAEHGTDGPANLALARTLARQGRLPEATAYYHRAIYGLWPEAPESSRAGARLELIELLAQHDQRQELLAELLPLEAAGLADSGLQRRVAHLFVAAGSPGRAVPLFRELLRDGNGDADVHAGLGDAEFTRGNFRAAAGEFRTALRLAPGDTAIARKLDLAVRVRSLDPMQRGLSPPERGRRARELLAAAAASARACLPAAAADSMRAALDSADAAVRAPERSAEMDEQLEANVALAERIWAERRAACAAPPAADQQAVELVLARLAD